MLDNNLFFLWTWTLIGVVVSVLIVTIGLYNGYKQSLIAQVIIHGTNPIEASCAFDGRLDGSCAIRAVK